MDATDKATICSRSHKEECLYHDKLTDDDVDNNKWMAWNVYVTDPKASIQFSLYIDGIDENTGRNKNRNKNKNKNKNRNKNRNKRRQSNPEDECKAGWVMIVEGDRKMYNPFVILPWTCLDKRRENVTTAFSDTAQVYFKKGEWVGETGRFRLTAESLAPTNPSSCLWDCEWKDNPVFPETTFWRIGNDTICGVFDPTLCVRIQLTMAQIPVDLTCLDDCFSNVPRKDYKEKCEAEKYPGGYSDDADIDCLLFNRKSDSQDRDNTYPEELVKLNGPRTTTTKPIQKQKPSSKTEIADDGPLFSNFLPTEPLDNALIFCIMARLDAFPVSELPSAIDGLYVGKKIWGGQTCSAFLPKIDWRRSLPNKQNVPFSNETSPALSNAQEERTLSAFRTHPSSRSKRRLSPRRTSNTRSSGPASAIIERY